MRLDGAVGVLTGATGGIGRPLAQHLAAAGMRLIVSARDPLRLDALARELSGSVVLDAIAGDLARCDVRERVAESARRHAAQVLVNLCGGNRFGLFARQTPADIEALVATNLTAPIQLTSTLLPDLQRRDEAMIVNIGSTFGAIGFPGYALYCATKFGLRGFSEALGRELSDGPVRVVYVAPRATRTAMNSFAATGLNAALGNAVDAPQRVAERIVDAMRSGSRRAGIGWRERCAARLNQVVPALVDAAIARQLGTIKSYAFDPDGREISR
ncbi:MAG TPA: SDR family oxidoreductase [Pseudomonadales bacterium]|nr:SDR family oxidoreductase [Pseudomonadales bacterium]